MNNMLFDLIKSMTQSEKRNFKIEATKYTRKKKSSYLILFEAIDKMKSYDEKKLHQYLKHEKFINRLSVEKNTLYKFILKSLKSYHASISKSSQVKHYLLEVEILFEKSLYTQCNNLLIKAEKVAITNGFQTQLLEIYKWKRTLWYIGERKTSFNIDKEEKIIKEIENNQQYNKLYTSLILLIDKYGYSPREKKILNKLTNLMNDPILMNKNSAISSSAKRTYHNIHANFNLFYKKHKEAHYHYDQVTYLMELTPCFIQNYPEQYMAAKYNKLICLMQIDKNETLSQLHLFRAIPEKMNIALNLRIRQFILSSYELELSLLINHCMFDYAKKLILNIAETLQDNQNIIGLSRYYNVCYASSYVFFILKEYKISLKFLNNIIIQQQESRISNELKAATRLLGMFIHYEINNKDLLPYLEQSANRFLSKNEILYDTEKLILKFFRKTLTDEIEMDLLKKEFIKFKLELIEILKEPLEKHFLERFDIIDWIESKISNIPFDEILISKYLSNIKIQDKSE